MQPWENQLDAALHFPGKLGNENEKPLKPAKITTKIPCESFLLEGGGG